MFMILPVCRDLDTNRCNKLNFIIPLIVGGIGNSFFGAVNSSMIALSVEKSDITLAFGIFGCMM
jgi:hypothetical protein